MAPTGHGTSTNPQKSTEVAPTSRWSKRALRPLTASLVRLEKHWQGTPLDSENFHRIHEQSAPIDWLPGGVGQQDAASSSDSDESPADPTWVPGTLRRKRIKHRYSARSQSRPGRRRVVICSPETTKLKPGQFTISTPLISGTEGKTGTQEDEEPDASVSYNLSLPPTRLTFPDDGDPYTRDASRRWEGPPYLEYDEPNYLSTAQKICDAWEAFLVMTRVEQYKPIGARSLLSMAISCTSKAILLEEEAQRQSEDKDDQEDVASRVFTDLEEVLDASVTGWKPMRQLVRSHGTNMICEAIKNKWLSPNTTYRLARIAVKKQCSDVAESLFSAWVAASPRMDPPTCGKSSVRFNEYFPVFDALLSYSRGTKFTSRPKKFSFECREIGNMLVNGTIAIDWMASPDFVFSLKLAMESITRNDEHAGASSEFVMKAVLVALGLHAPPKAEASPNSANGVDSSLPSQHPGTQGNGNQHRETELERTRSVTLNNSIASVMAILCTSYFAPFEEGYYDPAGRDLVKSRMLDIMLSLSTRVQQEIESGSAGFPKSLSRHRLIRICYVLMADILITGPHADDHDYLPYPGFGDTLCHNFNEFLCPLRGRNYLVDASSSFVLEVAHGWGRRIKQDGFEELRHITETMLGSMHWDLKRYPILRAFLGKVAVDASMKFAEAHDPHDMYDDVKMQAVCLQESLAKFHVDTEEWDSVPLTPSLDLSRGGFRWEDSFELWVSAINSREPPPQNYLPPRPSCLDGADDRDEKDYMLTKVKSTSKWTPSRYLRRDGEPRSTEERARSLPLRRNLFREAKTKKRPWSIYVDDDGTNNPSTLTSSHPTTEWGGRKSRSRSTARQALHKHTGMNRPSYPKSATRDITRPGKLSHSLSCDGFKTAATDNVCVNKKCLNKPDGLGGSERQGADTDESDEEDDIFTSAPTLSSLMRLDAVFNSHPSTPSRMSRPRSKARRLPSSTSLPNLRAQPCIPDETSDDELSFL